MSTFTKGTHYFLTPYVLIMYVLCSPVAVCQLANKQMID